jgi:LDH2 family malate/lactate/ureidoglycolate dehydrogenase
MNEQENHDPEEAAEENLTEENLKGAGQRILGTLEMLGGVITGDPVTTAEGEFNDDIGKLHQESAKNLTAIEEREEEK